MKNNIYTEITKGGNIDVFESKTAQFPLLKNAVLGGGRGRAGGGKRELESGAGVGEMGPAGV